MVLITGQRWFPALLALFWSHIRSMGNSGSLTGSVQATRGQGVFLRPLYKVSLLLPASHCSWPEGYVALSNRQVPPKGWKAASHCAVGWDPRTLRCENFPTIFWMFLNFLSLETLDLLNGLQVFLFFPPLSQGSMNRFGVLLGMTKLSDLE